MAIDIAGMNALFMFAEGEAALSLALRPAQNRLGWPTKPARTPLKRGRSAEVDAYTMVVLAEQERQANRTEQAKYLIEAAYARYDQCV